MSTKLDITNLESKRLSRVHQLRDLFQIGKPIPSEDLNANPDENDKGRPRSCTDPEKGTRWLNNETTPASSTSYINNNRIGADHVDRPTNGAIAQSSQQKNVSAPAMLTPQKHRTTSDSRLLVSPTTDGKSMIKSSDILETKSATNLSDRGSPNAVSLRPSYEREKNIALLYPVAPFNEYRNSKIRPLSDEFRAHRLSSSEDAVQSLSRPQSQEGELHPPSLSNLPMSSSSSESFPATSDQKPGHILVVGSGSLSGLGGGLDEEDDSDIDNLLTDENTRPHMASAAATVASTDDPGYDSLIDNYGQQLQSLNVDSSLVHNSTDSYSRNSINVTQEEPILVQSEELAQFLASNPEFQDYLLDTEDFKQTGPQNAEEVDLLDNSDRDPDEVQEEDNEEVEDYDLEHTNQEKTVITHDMISPRPQEVVLIDSECHILEDGHFFFERPAESTEAESLTADELYLLENREPRTYQRSGARIRFFLDSVRVYSTHTADEYNRRNEEIDPLSASAEYEMEKRLEKMNLFPVDLYKGQKGLGISILGLGVGHSVGLQKLGIFVKSIFAGGAADEDARIDVYDQIVEVNGQSLVCVSQEFAASVLRNTHGVVHFIVGRELDQTNSEIVRLVEKSRRLSGLEAITPAVSKAPIVIMTEEPMKEIQVPASVFSQDQDSDPEEEYVPMQNVDTDARAPSRPMTSSADSAAYTDRVEQMRQEMRSLRLDHTAALARQNDDAATVRSELTQLTSQHDRLKVDYRTLREDMDSRHFSLDELTNENHMLKDKLDIVTKKYKKLKRIVKTAENRNGDEAKITVYEDKIDKLQRKVVSLQGQINQGESDGNQHHDISHIINVAPSVAKDNRTKSRTSLLDDITIETHDHTESGASSLASSPSTTDSSPLVEQRPGTVIADSRQQNRSQLNQNCSNNVPVSATVNNMEPLFEGILAAPDSLLDCSRARAKVDIRPHRKPPTKSMMIGDGPEVVGPGRAVSTTPAVNSSHISKNISSPEYSQARPQNAVADPSATVAVTGTEPSSVLTNKIRAAGGFALPGKNDIKSGITPSSSAANSKKGVISSGEASGDNKIRKSSVTRGPKDHEKVVLMSAKPIANDAMLDGPRFITMPSSSSSSSAAVASGSPGIPSSYLPRDQSNKDSYTLASVPTQEPINEWQQNQIADWLKSAGISHLQETLIKGGVTSGYQLLRIDSDLIKRMGITNSNDRLVLKRKIKQLRENHSSHLAASQARSAQSRPPPTRSVQHASQF